MNRKDLVRIRHHLKVPYVFTMAGSAKLLVTDSLKKEELAYITLKKNQCSKQTPIIKMPSSVHSVLCN